LPRDLAELKPRIIAAVKNIDAPMLTRVCGKNLNIVSMCAVSPAVHTSNSYSCQRKKIIFPVAVNNSIKVAMEKYVPVLGLTVVADRPLS